MKKIIVLLFIVVSGFNVLGQNFVGAHKLEIKKQMSENHKDYFFSKEVFGGKNSFIKYEDTDGYRTLLLFSMTMAIANTASLCVIMVY
ncbi:MAG: hypothetical protein MZV63_44870 [Marinilabiliales bacterium]|nr:hypothetical protein [Marinilabiliales bacterium]